MICQGLLEGGKSSVRRVSAADGDPDQVAGQRAGYPGDTMGRITGHIQQFGAQIGRDQIGWKAEVAGCAHDPVVEGAHAVDGSGVTVGRASGTSPKAGARARGGRHRAATPPAPDITAANGADQQFDPANLALITSRGADSGLTRAEDTDRTVPNKPAI